jgi:hypothetical protein
LKRKPPCRTLCGKAVATPTQVNVVLNWVEEVKRIIEEKEKKKGT